MRKGGYQLANAANPEQMLKAILVSNNKRVVVTNITINGATLPETEVLFYPNGEKYTGVLNWEGTQYALSSDGTIEQIQSGGGLPEGGKFGYYLSKATQGEEWLPLQYGQESSIAAKTDSAGNVYFEIPSPISRGASPDRQFTHFVFSTNMLPSVGSIGHQFYGRFSIPCPTNDVYTSTIYAYITKEHIVTFNMNKIDSNTYRITVQIDGQLATKIDGNIRDGIFC